jgi:hypothetical protein
MRSQNGLCSTCKQLPLDPDENVARQASGQLALGTTEDIATRGTLGRCPLCQLQITALVRGTISASKPDTPIFCRLLIHTRVCPAVLPSDSVVASRFGPLLVSTPLLPLVTRKIFNHTGTATSDGTRGCKLHCILDTRVPKSWLTMSWHQGILVTKAVPIARGKKGEKGRNLFGKWGDVSIFC